MSLYHLEHSFLPEWFFESLGALIHALLSDNDLLFSVIGDMYSRQGKTNPYSPGDFSVTPLKVYEDLYVMKVGFPEPDAEPLSYSAFMIFSPDYERKMFFCLESGRRMPSKRMSLSFAGGPRRGTT